ncbi:hypothetical protein POTOM_031572 [Populus tomentosa]|uniref:non-specific serine/threonine protein kinase n=1 Tax=Populus tomentosa TaxID=118781 RepID=A0A8X7Z6M9_POPTO|nr:hypothetical protein POTOM_031572 [Populus tomentosa]
MLILVGLALWCMRKQRKEISGLNGVYVMPSSLGSSPRSGSTFTKTHSTAPLITSGSSSDCFSLPPESSGLGNSRPLFALEELVKATNGFSSQNLLGEGGFGTVYKGYLPDGRDVAVKQLKIGGGQGEREFKAEVEIISRIHHRHLVSLVGYCISETRRLLVYDYVPNNTLHFHLHEVGRPALDWATRVKIAAGAARGLAYLHEDCHPRIIHRDIKSSNILLDINFEAKVSDFGLAKLALDTNTHVTTRVMGTFGYMAPEYASSGKLTDKSDVFSYGVVLLELITGRKPVDASQPVGEESLVEWARPLLNHALENEEFESLADPRLEKNYIESEMFQMVEAAAVCVRHSATKRPRMGQVVRAFHTLATADLTNGMRVGESELFNSAQQSEEIRLFRRMAFAAGFMNFEMEPIQAQDAQDGERILKTLQNTQGKACGHTSNHLIPKKSRFQATSGRPMFPFTSNILFFATYHSVCFTLSDYPPMRTRNGFLIKTYLHQPFFFINIIPFLLPSWTSMEDLNMLAADCVVISCCCQCLILQSIIFVLLKLPHKVIQKTRAYAKKKLWHRKKEKMLESVRGRFQDSFDKFLEGSIEIQVDDFHGGHDCESCIEEVEEVLEGFSQKGEFAFGSFWGRVGSGTSTACIVAVQEFDFSVAQFQAALDICNNSPQLMSWRCIGMRIISDGLELAALLHSLGLKPTGYQLHALFSNMDANGNGHVEFDDLFNAVLPDMNEEVLINQEQCLEVFRSFDRDGNGFITAAELAGSMAKMGQPLKFQMANGYGLVSFLKLCLDYKWLYVGAIYPDPLSEDKVLWGTMQGRDTGGSSSES